MRAQKIIKRSMLWLAMVLTSVLTYLGSLVVIAYLMNGDERSLIIAVFPALLSMGIFEQSKGDKR